MLDLKKKTNNCFWKLHLKSTRLCQGKCSLGLNGYVLISHSMCLFCNEVDIFITRFANSVLKIWKSAVSEMLLCLCLCPLSLSDALLLFTAVCTLHAYINSGVRKCRAPESVCRRHAWGIIMFVYSAKGNAERAWQLKWSHLNLLAQQGRLNHSSDTKNKISHWYKAFIFISYHVFTMYQPESVKTPSNIQQQPTTPASESLSFKSCQNTGLWLVRSRLLDS